MSLLPKRKRLRREPWETPWLDLRRRFTARGRATLRVKAGLVATVLQARKDRDLMVIAEEVRRDRDDLRARFDAWDDEDSRRIREELLTTLASLFPSTPREALLATARNFRRLARDLPTKASDEAALRAEVP